MIDNNSYGAWLFDSPTSELSWNFVRLSFLNIFTLVVICCKLDLQNKALLFLGEATTVLPSKIWPLSEQKWNPVASDHKVKHSSIELQQSGIVNDNLIHVYNKKVYMYMCI